MKKPNIELYKRINEKYRKYIIVLIFAIFIISSVLTFLSIRQPYEIEEKVIKNTIEEKTSFDYKAKVIPCTLYPEGGIITPDNVIFKNLTEDFIVEINSQIMTDQPVKIEATKSMKYNLIAEKMWEREFVLKQPFKRNYNGISHDLVNEDIHININEINDYLTKIEEETLIRPNYTIIVKSEVTGNIYDENDNIIYEINNILEIPFELSGQYIRYAGETEEKEFINTKSIEQVNIIPQQFNLFGLSLSVTGSRLCSGITAFISLVLLIIFIIEKITNKPASLSEINLIEKKNKGNIINITNKMDIGSMPQVTVKSFKELLKISEEKEESILKYFDESLGIVYYYITTSSFIYIYKSSVVIKGSEKLQDA